jgi:hypothetical protein
MRIFVAVLSTIGVNQHGRIFAINIRKAIAKIDGRFCFKWISSALWVDFPKTRGRVAKNTFGLVLGVGCRSNGSDDNKC